MSLLTELEFISSLTYKDIAPDGAGVVFGRNFATIQVDDSPKAVYFWIKMKTCSLSDAKSSLGRLADAALQGHPTVISRSGKLLILRAFEPPDPDEFDALIAEGINSEHFPLTDSVWDGIRQRGRKLAQKLRKE
jgi:hypothetical protein